MPVRFTRLVPAGLGLALALAACSGSGASPTAGTASSAEPAAPASAAASGSGEPSVAPSGPASPVASAGASASASASAAPSGEADIVVTAVDYAYQGIPPEVASGTTLGLTNSGQEVHELIVVRKPPTTTQTFEELLALPPDQAQGLVEDVGFAFAEPGATAAETITLGEPGDYLAVCFIPAGTTSLPSIDPDAPAPPSLGAGAPHFTLGMAQTFTVTE